MYYNYSRIIFWIKKGFHFCDKIEITALVASAPLFFLAIACFMLKQVIIPLPIGFLWSIDKSIIPLVVAWEMKSKWGVSPLITHPSAKNPSNFLIFFDIVTGISNTPGTFIILTIFDLGINSRALLRSAFEISL